MNKPIISFAAILLSIVFVFFYVMPAYNLNQERRGDIESLKKILSASSEIKTLINKTKKNLSSIDSAGMTRFGVFLPETIDPIRLANNIQSIGIKNGIVLSGIKVDEPAKSAQGGKASGAGSVSQGFMNTMSLNAKMDQAQGGTASQGSLGQAGGAPDNKYAPTKVSFDFTATYETFQLFLNDLQSSLGLLEVSSLSFTPAAEKTDTKSAAASSVPNYKFTMTVETYSLK